MKERYYISFSATKKDAKYIRNIFKQINREKLLDSIRHYDYGYCGFYIWSNDSNLSFIRQKLKNKKWLYSERLEKVFTKEELLSCKLLLLTVNRAPKGFGGPSYGTKFDMSKACKICGTGAIQISELILRESDIPKTRDITQTYDYEIIISRKIKGKFLKENIKGVELRPILSNKDKKEFGYFQIIPKNTLPPFSDTSKITIENQCQKCKRQGFYWPTDNPLELHYNNLNESILKKADVFNTYEHFGISKFREPFSESKFATPLLIVKPNIFKIFNELKVKGTRFEPVIVNGFPDLNKWKTKNDINY